MKKLLALIITGVFATVAVSPTFAADKKETKKEAKKDKKDKKK
jgi:hypothetical protein